MFKKLNCSTQMPMIGLGCWKSYGDEAYSAVRSALSCGYRHIDTASRYQNEAIVGKAIRDSGIARDQIFVTSKLWQTGFDHPESGIEYSLKELGCEYIDLYLLHWPGTDKTLRLKAWEALIKRLEKGDIRAIGVSNFTVSHLEELVAAFGFLPAVNQIELHPWQQQREISAYCFGHNIAVEAWGPILRGHLDEEPVLSELAAKYEKSPAQVTLRWQLQKGNIAIPKSVHPQRIAQNLDVFDFSLSAEDVARIDGLDRGKGFANDPFTYTGEDFHI